MGNKIEKNGFICPLCKLVSSFMDNIDICQHCFKAKIEDSNLICDKCSQLLEECKVCGRKIDSGLKMIEDYSNSLVKIEKITCFLTELRPSIEKKNKKQMLKKCQL